MDAKKNMSFAIKHFGFLVLQKPTKQKRTKNAKCSRMLLGWHVCVRQDTELPNCAMQHPVSTDQNWPSFNILLPQPNGSKWHSALCIHTTVDAVHVETF